jgi:hypothetical protein
VDRANDLLVEPSRFVHLASSRSALR